MRSALDSDCGLRVCSVAGRTPSARRRCRVGKGCDQSVVAGGTDFADERKLVASTAGISAPGQACDPLAGDERSRYAFVIGRNGFASRGYLFGNPKNQFPLMEFIPANQNDSSEVELACM